MGHQARAADPDPTADYALLPSREQTRSASAECLVPGGSSGMRCPFAGPWGWPLGLVPLPDMSVRALARACGPGVSRPRSGGRRRARGR